MYNRLMYVGIVLLAGQGCYAVQKYSAQQRCISEQRCSLRTAMRKLWSDHVWWTRNYLIAAIADMPELKETTDRLMQNQEDIGNAIVPYYGKKAGKKLTKLLKEHILIAADVVKAAKKGDAAQLKKADAQWHANADEIAAFLSKANPNWPYATVKEMMYMHLKLTTQEAVARIKQNWAADVAAFDKVFDEIMEMADALTNGIVQQFPDKF
jgi:hypothetical protein